MGTVAASCFGEISSSFSSISDNGLGVCLWLEMALLSLGSSGLGGVCPLARSSANLTGSPFRFISAEERGVLGAELCGVGGVGVTPMIVTFDLGLGEGEGEREAFLSLS